MATVCVLSTFMLCSCHHHSLPEIFASYKTETLYPLNNHSPVPPILTLEAPFYFLFYGFDCSGYKSDHNEVHNVYCVCYTHSSNSQRILKFNSRLLLVMGRIVSDYIHSGCFSSTNYHYYLRQMPVKPRSFCISDLISINQSFL